MPFLLALIMMNSVFPFYGGPVFRKMLACLCKVESLRSLQGFLVASLVSSVLSPSYKNPCVEVVQRAFVELGFESFGLRVWSSPCAVQYSKPKKVANAEAWGSHLNFLSTLVCLWGPSLHPPPHPILGFIIMCILHRQAQFSKHHSPSTKKPTASPYLYILLILVPWLLKGCTNCKQTGSLQRLHIQPAISKSCNRVRVLGIRGGLGSGGY